MNFEFPKHLSLSIEHNRHKGYCEKLSDYLKRDGMDRIKELSEEEYKRCIETDELWECQLYPDTPMSFYYFCAPTLQECLEKMGQLRNLNKFME